MKQRIAAVVAIALAACTTQPKPAPLEPPPPPPAPRATPAAKLNDVAGESVETAIDVPADAPNEGIDFENAWIYEKYGKFRRRSGGTGNLNGRRYEVIEIELWGGATKKVFFDITENWKRWRPPQ